MTILSKNVSAEYQNIINYLCNKTSTDEEFISIYNQVNKFAPVMIGGRGWFLFELLKYLSSNGSTGSFLEVGCWRGGSGAIISLSAKYLGMYDNTYLCDTFKGVVKPSGKDNTYVGGEHSDTSRTIVERLLFQLQLADVRILEGVFPEETGKFIDKNEKFRLIHIDVDTYLSASDALDWIWPNMSKGGIVVYDDYGHGICAGIRTHVEEHADDVDKIVFVHPITLHAVMIKL